MRAQPLISAVVGCVLGATVVCLLGGVPFLGRATVASAETPRTKLLENYVAAQLKLAKVELQQVEQANKLVPKTFPKAYEDRLRNHVAIKEDQMQFVQTEGRDDFVKFHKRQADANAKLAEQDLLRALIANKEKQGTVPEIELSRLESTAEVARLHAALADNPADIQSSMTLLMWQLDQLSEDVMELEMKVTRLSLSKQSGHK